MNAKKFFFIAAASAAALSAVALDNTLTDGFWDTTGYANAGIAAHSCTATLSAPVDSCVKAERASDAPAKFHTFKSGMFIVIR